MSASYATREDVFRVGLPRGSLVNSSRPLAAVDATLNRLHLDDHGFALDRPIQFVADLGAYLPPPLVVGVVYYARPVAGSDSLFEVAATAGGAAIDFTAEGSGVVGVIASLGPEIDDENETHSRWLDGVFGFSTAQALTPPFPRWAVTIVAKRTAASLVRRFGLSGYQGIIDEAAEATKDALRMANAAEPLRDDNEPLRVNLAIRSNSTSRPSRGGSIP